MSKSRFTYQVINHENGIRTPVFKTDTAGELSKILITAIENYPHEKETYLTNKQEHEFSQKDLPKEEKTQYEVAPPRDLSQDFVLLLIEMHEVGTEDEITEFSKYPLLKVENFIKINPPTEH